MARPWAPYEASIPVVIARIGANLGWLKIRSGTRSQPVDQEADRTFGFLFAESTVSITKTIPRSTRGAAAYQRCVARSLRT